MNDERLHVHRFVLGPLNSNCYLVFDPSSREALIVDPGDEPGEIAAAVDTARLRVVGIVDTHCHADHIGANDAIKRLYQCPLMVHELDAPGLTNSAINLSAMIDGSSLIGPPADRLLKDGDQIELGAASLTVIHTPGHTPGGICLWTNGLVLAGDTLFANGVGRVDFPGGSASQLSESIQVRLMCLPDDTIVYPGHGPETTIGLERTNKPWLFLGARS